MHAKKMLWGVGFLLTFSMSACTAEPNADDPLDPSESALAVDTGDATELGVKFSVTKPTTVTGIKVYRSDSSVRIGSLWNVATQRRATTGILQPGSQSGATEPTWVTATFAKPIVVEPGESFIASYYSPQGTYSVSSGVYAAKKTDGPIVYPALAGTMTTQAGQMPNTAGSSSYLVEVLYEGKTSSVPPTTAGAPKITATASTASSISLAWTSASIAQGTQYTVRYTASGSPTSREDTVDASKGDGITLDDLTPSTPYALVVFPTATSSASVALTVSTKGNAVPAGLPIQVAVVGDSNTTGFKGHLETGIQTGYAYIAQVKGYIQFAGGWARDGSTSAVMNQNVTAVPTAKVTIIMAGTNDLTKNVTDAELESNLKSISKKVGAPNTLILAIPPFNAANVRAAQVNVSLKSIAARNGFAFFDPWTKHRTADNKWVAEYMREGLHTTKEGYRVMGLEVERFVALKYAGFVVP